MTTIVIGSTGRRTATQLAEDALNRMNKGRRYGVGLDWSGHVTIGLVGDIPTRDLLMVCTSASDPDVLADNIRDEVNARDPNHRPRQRRVLSRKA